MHIHENECIVDRQGFAVDVKNPFSMLIYHMEVSNN